MKGTGITLIILGIVATVRAWFMDISVAGSGAYDRFINNGLVADRQLWLSSGLGLLLIGAVLLAASAILQELHEVRFLLRSAANSKD